MIHLTDIEKSKEGILMILEVVKDYPFGIATFVISSFPATRLFTIIPFISDPCF